MRLSDVVVASFALLEMHFGVYHAAFQLRWMAASGQMSPFASSMVRNAKDFAVRVEKRPDQMKGVHIGCVFAAHEKRGEGTMSCTFGVSLLRNACMRRAISPTEGFEGCKDAAEVSTSSSSRQCSYEDRAAEIESLRVKIR